ncbi:MAG: NTP transferase domain-containing protein [Euryarchaeota archaeon]|nr:NTP transferase domain-containing protein [Euryarchaeota archaeon]
MAVTALIMAGGKGKRLKINEEKPLLKIQGKTLIERVISAVKTAKNIDEIIVAVSKFTPKTAKFVKSFGVKAIETPGEEYCSDLKYIIKNYKFEVILTISADLPFLSGAFIDSIIEFYKRSSFPALSVVAPLDIFSKVGLKPSTILTWNGIQVVPIGINIVNGQIAGEQEEVVFIARDLNLIFNINTIEDLEIAENFLKIEHFGLDLQKLKER